MLNLASKKLQKHSQYFSPSYRKRAYWNRLINCSQLQPFWENFKNARLQNTPIDTSRVNQWTRISCLSDVFPSSCWQSLTSFQNDHLVPQIIIWQTTHPTWKTLVSSLLPFSCFKKNNKTSKFSFQLMCKERCWICLNIWSPKIYSFCQFSKQTCSFSVQFHLLLLISTA